VAHVEGMQIGIAIDGTGSLGRPAAVTTLGRAADSLGYGSIWCLGPWAQALVGSVALVTTRVRIGLEAPSAEDHAAALTVCGDRLVVVGRLPTWSPGGRALRGDSDLQVVRIEAAATHVAGIAEAVRGAAVCGFEEVVVHLVDSVDIALDDALAAYAELGELIESVD
jgi:hypothetical protein